MVLGAGSWLLTVGALGNLHQFLGSWQMDEEARSRETKALLSATWGPPSGR